MKLGIYAVALAAVKMKSDIPGMFSAGSAATVCFAVSQDEASGIAYRTCHEHFKNEDGWSMHTCSVRKVDDEDIARIGYVKLDLPMEV